MEVVGSARRPLFAGGGAAAHPTARPATPAGPGRATVRPSGLVPRAGAGRREPARPRQAHRLRGAAGAGAAADAALDALPPRAQPRQVVAPGRQSGLAGPAGRHLRAHRAARRRAGRDAGAAAPEGGYPGRRAPRGDWTAPRCGPVRRTASTRAGGAGGAGGSWCRSPGPGGGGPSPGAPSAPPPRGLTGRPGDATRRCATGHGQPCRCCAAGSRSGPAWSSRRAAPRAAPCWRAVRAAPSRAPSARGAAAPPRAPDPPHAARPASVAVRA